MSFEWLCGIIFIGTSTIDDECAAQHHLNIFIFTAGKVQNDSAVCATFTRAPPHGLEMYCSLIYDTWYCVSYMHEESREKQSTEVTKR